MRRGEGPELSVAEACVLVGLDDVPADVEPVVSQLLEGQDVELAPDAPTPSRATALVAGLATPGTTLWVVDLPALQPIGPAPPARQGNGAVSTSIAREPSPPDREAMREEAQAVPEFRFLRRGQVTPALADEVGAGLVVAQPGADPGPGVGRPRLLLP